MYVDAIKHLSENGNIPKFNRLIAEGVGYAQAKDGILRKVDSILKRELSSSSENPKLPPGLVYEGSRPHTPLEGFISAVSRKPTQRNNNKTIINISRTDEFLASLKFRLPNGEYLHRQMYIPYIRRGGFMYSWGTEYHAAAVIHTQGISTEGKSLFVNFDFTRKVKFMDCKQPVRLRVDGAEEVVSIPGTISMYGAKEGKGSDPGPKPIAYWLFAKYGFKEAIKRYTGINVNIMPAMLAHGIDHDKQVLVTMGDKLFAKDCQFVVVIDKEDLPSYNERRWSKNEHMLFTMLGAFFKAARFYLSKNPNNGKVRGQAIQGKPLFSYVSMDDWAYEVEDLNSPDTWMLVLGRSYIGGQQDDVEIYSRVKSHLTECERYLNRQFRSELYQSDPSIDPNLNTFDFLHYVSQRMLEVEVNKGADAACMYGKRLTIVDYMLLGSRGFNATVSSIRWKIESAYLNNKDKDINVEISSQLNKRLNCGLIRKTENNTTAISTYNAATESLVLAISTSAKDQTETDPKAGKKRSSNLNDRTKHLSISQFECGSGIYSTKAGPFRYSILNPYVLTTPQLVMKRNPELQHIVKPAEEDIKHLGGN